MKKSIKTMLILIAAVIFLIIAIASVRFFPRLSMKPAATDEILNTEIYAVKNEINSLYFVETDIGYIVIDAGSNPDKVKEALNEIDIDPLSVKYVLLTHSDYDHVASLNLFSNAQIYMSEDELQMINGITKRNAGINNTLPDGVNLDSLVLLKDGQDLLFGEHTIKCIKTPGHTPGSMSYLLDKQYLFTGDAVMISNGVISIHPYTMNKGTSKESIQKIVEIAKQCEIVITAHYGYYKTDTLELD